MAFPTLIDVGETVELRAVLLALGSLLVWVGALILAGLAVALVETILWPLNKAVAAITLGVVDSVPGSHAVEQFFTDRLGQAAHGVDAAAGGFWHGLKTLAVQVGEEIAGLAVLGVYLYWWAANTLPQIIWHRFAKAIHGDVQGAKAIAQRAERDAIRVEKYARHEVKVIDRRIGAIAHDVEGVVLPELKSTRELAKEAEQLAQNAWDYITSRKFTNWIEGLVAAAIAAAGIVAFDFLKCAEWRRLGGRLTCGMGQFLLDLLEGAIAVMLVEDICAITKLGIEVIESGPVMDFLSTVEGGMQDLLTCQGVDLPPTLTGTYFAPPPVQSPAVLG